MGKYSDETIFICACYSTEHQIVFEVWKDDEKESNDEIAVNIHLVKRPFLKRIVCGIKYIFGYKCRYGSFDTFSFQPWDYDKLQKIVDKMKRVNDLNIEKI